MRTLEQMQERVSGYKDVDYIYDPKVGYIVWRVATGDNLEALFIEAAEHGKGHGKELYRRMCLTLIERGLRPYHSVFGFRLASNVLAERFYASMDFQQIDLGQSIYAGDRCVLVWNTWKNVLRVLRIA